MLKHPAAALAAAMLLMSIPILLGGWWGFPAYDDGYLILLLRENGAAQVAAGHTDRPLVGLVMHAFAGLFGESPLPYLIANLLLWFVLVLQTAALWRHLFPARAALSPVAAAAVLSPVVVVTQYTTLTTSLPVNAACAIAFGGCYLLLTRNGAAARVGGAALILLGVTVSEYGVATAGGFLVLLTGLRHYGGAAITAASAVAGYGLFRTITDTAVRPDVDPAVQGAKALGGLRNLPLELLTTMWQAVAGAWGQAAASVAVGAESVSGIAAFLFALLAAGSMYLYLRREHAAVPGNGRTVVLLAGAVAAGLLPVLLAGRHVELREYSTRFLLPVLPFALLTTFELMLRLLDRRGQVAALTGVAFLCGFSAADGAFAMRREQIAYADMGEQLHRSLSGPGVHLVAGPTRHWSAVMTAKATYRWPGSEPKRVWFLSRREALKIAGDRYSCRKPAEFSATILRGISRSGPVPQVLWAHPETAETPAELRPYCLAPEQQHTVAALK